MKICFVWDISVPDNFLSQLDILGLDSLWELKIWMNNNIICLQKVSYYINPSHSETLTELRAGEGAMLSRLAPPPVIRSSSRHSIAIGPETGYCALIGPAFSLWFIWQKMLLARFLFDLEWLLEMSNATGVSSIICESSGNMLSIRVYSIIRRILIISDNYAPGTVSSASRLSLSSCLAYLDNILKDEIDDGTSHLSILALLTAQ